MSLQRFQRRALVGGVRHIPRAELVRANVVHLQDGLGQCCGIVGLGDLNRRGARHWKRLRGNFLGADLRDGIEFRVHGSLRGRLEVGVDDILVSASSWAGEDGLIFSLAFVVSLLLISVRSFVRRGPLTSMSMPLYCTEKTLSLNSLASKCW